jgi:RNA polymerase sigma factor (sigma-70 family)
MGGKEERREIRSDAGGMSQAVWAKLYRKFYPRIRARLSARVANEHDAQDLAQQVFMELARTKVPEDPGRYVYAIAWNLVAQYRRRRAAEQNALAEYQRREESAGAEARWYDATADPPQEDSRQKIERLRRFVADRLSPQDAELVTLRFFEARPIKEVAQRMHCTENAVNKRLQKLRPILRRLFRQ